MGLLDLLGKIKRILVYWLQAFYIDCNNVFIRFDPSQVSVAIAHNYTEEYLCF